MGLHEVERLHQYVADAPWQAACCRSDWRDVEIVWCQAVFFELVGRPFDQRVVVEGHDAGPLGMPTSHELEQPVRAGGAKSGRLGRPKLLLDVSLGLEVAGERQRRLLSVLPRMVTREMR